MGPPAGDCYLVLDTFLAEGVPRHHVHFWLGKDATQVSSSPGFTLLACRDCVASRAQPLNAVPLLSPVSTVPFPTYASALTLPSLFQDEAGSVAIFASQLDEALGGGPVQFRQPQVRPGQQRRNAVAASGTARLGSAP